jgi:hypothetical protein
MTGLHGVGVGGGVKLKLSLPIFLEEVCQNHLRHQLFSVQQK